MPRSLTQESISWPKGCMQSWNMFRKKTELLPLPQKPPRPQWRTFLTLSICRYLEQCLFIHFFINFMRESDKLMFPISIAPDHTCADDSFKCRNHRCLSPQFVCDGNFDCGIDDSSDEESNCTTSGTHRFSSSSADAEVVGAINIIVQRLHLHWVTIYRSSSVPAISLLEFHLQDIYLSLMRLLRYPHDLAHERFFYS